MRELENQENLVTGPLGPQLQLALGCLYHLQRVQAFSNGFRFDSKFFRRGEYNYRDDGPRASVRVADKDITAWKRMTPYGDTAPGVYMNQAGVRYAPTAENSLEIQMQYSPGYATSRAMQWCGVKINDELVLIAPLIEPKIAKPETPLSEVSRQWTGGKNGKSPLPYWSITCVDGNDYRGDQRRETKILQASFVPNSVRGKMVTGVDDEGGLILDDGTSYSAHELCKLFDSLPKMIEGIIKRMDDLDRQPLTPTHHRES